MPFQPTINNEQATKHNESRFLIPTQARQDNIPPGSKMRTKPLPERLASITTPSKQGSPTGRRPSCQEQGRASLPPSDWPVTVLLSSDWLSQVWDGLDGWRLWTRARDRVCSRVGRGEEGKGGRYCMPGSLNNTAAQHRKEHYDAL